MSLVKSMTLMEIMKIVSKLVLIFDCNLVSPYRDWTVHNDWFVK